MDEERSYIEGGKRGRAGGQVVGMSLKNHLGKMILFFLQSLKFLLGNIVQLLGQLKVNQGTIIATDLLSPPRV